MDFTSGSNNTPDAVVSEAEKKNLSGLYGL